MFVPLARVGRADCAPPLSTGRSERALSAPEATLCSTPGAGKDFGPPDLSRRHLPPCPAHAGLFTLLVTRDQGFLPRD